MFKNSVRGMQYEVIRDIHDGTFTIISPALKRCTINNFLHEERYMSWFVWALYCSLGPPLYQCTRGFIRSVTDYT